jgi:hypothetical protein
LQLVSWLRCPMPRTAMRCICTAEAMNGWLLSREPIDVAYCWGFKRSFQLLPCGWLFGPCGWSMSTKYWC